MYFLGEEAEKEAAQRADHSSLASARGREADVRA